MNQHKLLLFALPLLASLAQAQQPPDSAWRAANQRVAEFPRGHADVLKWEQAHLAAATTAPATPATLVLNTLADGVRLAWQAHPDLAKPLAQLGAEQAGSLASGQWQAVSAARLRRIDDAAELMDVAHATRKTLLAAMAVEQALPHQQQALQAAQAAAELGARMAQTGNWSQLQAAQRQRVLIGAEQQWQRSQYAAAHSRANVLKALQQWLRASPHTLQLPAALPALPATALDEQAVQSRLTQVADTLAGSGQIAMRANAPLAYRAYATAYALASSQQQLLKLQQFIYDETVLRYNGMLLNSWELLDAARTLAEARVNAIDALRDFWLAEADLQLVLLGGQPENFVTLAAGGGDSPAAAGH